MIIALFFIIVSLVIELLGVFQIIKKSRRGALNWYFFAICTIIAFSTFNNALVYYTAFSKGVTLTESGYVFSYLNEIITSSKILIVPSIFAFILNLSKIKSKGFKALQRILITVNMTAFLLIIVILVTLGNTADILSSLHLIFRSF